MRLYEAVSLNFIHFIIVVYVLVNCCGFSDCLNMWTSLEKRQAPSKVKKNCLSPCKLFHIMCKNDGKCKQRGSDCTWYCECPKNCKGFFCETIINSDEEATAQESVYSVNLEHTSTKNGPWVGEFNKKVLKDILTMIQRNPEEVKKTESRKKENKKKTVCPPKALNITSTNNPESVTQMASENVTSTTVTKSFTQNGGIETSTPMPIVRSSFTTTDSPSKSTNTFQSTSKDLETSTSTSVSTTERSKSEKTVKQKVLSRKAKPLDELIEEAIAIITISTAKPSMDSTMSTPVATSDVSSTTQVLSSSVSQTRGVSSTTNAPTNSNVTSATHEEITTSKKQKGAVTTAAKITLTTGKKQMRSEKSTFSTDPSTTTGSTAINTKAIKTGTTTPMTKLADSASVSKRITVEKKQAGKIENNSVKNNNASTEPSNKSLVEKTSESINSGHSTKSTATSKEAKQTTATQKSTISTSEAPKTTTMTMKPKAQTTQSHTTIISTSEAPQTAKFQTTTSLSTESSTSAETTPSQSSIDESKTTVRNNPTTFESIKTSVQSTTSTDAVLLSTTQPSIEKFQADPDSTNKKLKLKSTQNKQTINSETKTSKSSLPEQTNIVTYHDTTDNFVSSTASTTDRAAKDTTTSMPQEENVVMKDLTETKPKLSEVNDLEQPNNSKTATREKHLSQDDKSIVTTEINVSPSLSLEQLNQTSVSTLSHEVPNIKLSSTSHDPNQDMTVTSFETKTSLPTPTEYTETAATTPAIVSDNSTVIPDVTKLETNSTQTITNSDNKDIKASVDSTSDKLKSKDSIAENIETTTLNPDVTSTEVSSSSISPAKTTVLMYEHAMSTATPSTYIDHFNDKSGSVRDNSGLKHSDKGVDHELADIFFKTKTKKEIISDSLSKRNDLKLDLQKWKELHEKGLSNDLRNLL